jgi:hypothetical protein
MVCATTARQIPISSQKTQVASVLAEARVLSKFERVAVTRYGTLPWGSIALEIQNRMSGGSC